MCNVHQLQGHFQLHHINLSRVEAQNTSFNVAEQSSSVSVMRKDILFSNEMFYILKLFS